MKTESEMQHRLLVAIVMYRKAVHACLDNEILTKQALLVSKLRISENVLDRVVQDAEKAGFLVDSKDDIVIGSRWLVVDRILTVVKMDDCMVWLDSGEQVGQRGLLRVGK